MYFSQNRTVRDGGDRELNRFHTRMQIVTTNVETCPPSLRDLPRTKFSLQNTSTNDLDPITLRCHPYEVQNHPIVTPHLLQTNFSVIGVSDELRKQYDSIINTEFQPMTPKTGPDLTNKDNTIVQSAYPIPHPPQPNPSTPQTHPLFPPGPVSSQPPPRARPETDVEMGNDINAMFTEPPHKDPHPPTLTEREMTFLHTHMTHRDHFRQKYQEYRSIQSHAHQRTVTEFLNKLSHDKTIITEYTNGLIALWRDQKMKDAQETTDNTDLEDTTSLSGLEELMMSLLMAIRVQSVALFSQSHEICISVATLLMRLLTTNSAFPPLFFGFCYYFCPHLIPMNDFILSQLERSAPTNQKAKDILLLYKTDANSQPERIQNQIVGIERIFFCTFVTRQDPQLPNPFSDQDRLTWLDLYFWNPSDKEFAKTVITFVKLAGNNYLTSKSLRRPFYHTFFTSNDYLTELGRISGPCHSQFLTLTEQLKQHHIFERAPTFD
ncbi:hypothetical protein BLNAU_137 [Blattamonas nauphoetae]|uniref:Uncharacterized protein n=1 Tax=Blattamonas nauphoetae TaxID=2049346 RepID=A0ABQ9YM49_9EUKA|nr:hypothetical protein BLNAU_137 [Blattamonas nauphoetae]